MVYSPLLVWSLSKDTPDLLFLEQSDKFTETILHYFPWYCRSDCYVIKPKTDDYHIKYILGLLNCSLYYFWFYTKGKRKGNTLELFQTPLSETPIKKLPTNEQILLSSIVDQILLEIYSIDFAINFDRQKVVKNLKREIDEMVYTSFRLSKSEMKDIDEFIKSKKINL